MFGLRPDIHNLRMFGSLAYAHLEANARRHKLQSNAKIGYVLGYAEDIVGCKPYYPDERTRKYGPDIRVNENVLYRDRHTTEYAVPGTVGFGEYPSKRAAESSMKTKTCPVK